MDTFQTLCGHNNLDRVALVTTKWESNTNIKAHRIQVGREKELHQGRWKEMIKAGSIVDRFHGNKGSAVGIIHRLLDNRDKAPFRAIIRNEDTISRIALPIKAPDEQHITQSRWPFTYHVFWFIVVLVSYHKLIIKVLGTLIDSDVVEKVTLTVWIADIFYLLFKYYMVQEERIPILYN